MPTPLPIFQHANPHANRLVVYTAIFGNYDCLREPLPSISGCGFVCFTDNPDLRSERFDVVVCKPVYPDPTRNTRIFKLLPHRFFPNHEYSLWIDGSVDLKTDTLPELADELLREHDIAICRHTARDCIYDELEACVLLNKDNEETMRRQVEKYRQEGYPAHHGLTENGVIFRRHNAAACVRLDETWWNEVAAHSKRDQLSFNYACWKTQTPYGLIPGFVWDNVHFKANDHKASAQEKALQELEARVRKQEVAIQEQILAFQEQQAAIHQQEATIHQQEATIHQQEATIHQQEATIHRQQAEIQKLAERIMAIEHSDGHRLLLHYYACRDRLLPHGSRRRHLAKRIFRIIRPQSSPEN